MPPTDPTNNTNTIKTKPHDNLSSVDTDTEPIDTVVVSAVVGKIAVYKSYKLIQNITNTMQIKIVITSFKKEFI